MGANYIYMGQYAVLASKYPHLKPVLHHMWEQEIHHHNTFNKLQTKRRVRPSLLTPLWKLGAIGMGWHSIDRERSSYGMYSCCGNCDRRSL